MIEFMPSDHEELRRWCQHQIDHLPDLGPVIGLTPAEVAVFVEDCTALIAALPRPSRSKKPVVPAAKKNLARVKRTSLRRLVEGFKRKPAYTEETGRQLQWMSASARPAAVPTANLDQVLFTHAASTRDLHAIPV